MSVKSLSDLSIELGKFEKQYLYTGNVHQTTIDLVESFTIDYNNFIYSEYKNFIEHDFIGSCLYQVNNLLEICDKSLEDYNVLIELQKLLESYE